MKIQLIENEIQEALQQYLKNIISITDDKKFSIKILATRGDNGVTAEVTIEPNTKQTVVEPEKVEVKTEVTTISTIEPSGKLEPVAKKSLFAGLHSA